MIISPPNQLELALRGLIIDYGRKPTLAEAENAYSADKLGENKIGHPFAYRGALHVHAGGFSLGKHREIAVAELIPIEKFDGTPTTYAQRISRDGGEIARADVRGFYYGIAVWWKGKRYIVGRETGLLVFEGEKLIAEKPSDRAERRGKSKK